METCPYGEEGWRAFDGRWMGPAHGASGLRRDL